MTDLAPAADRVLASRERNDRNRLHIRIWLGVVLLAIFALVLVGGATRLTDSGLSITQWKPIHGVIPPLSVAEPGRLPPHSPVRLLAPAPPALRPPALRLLAAWSWPTSTRTFASSQLYFSSSSGAERCLRARQL